MATLRPLPAAAAAALLLAAAAGAHARQGILKNGSMEFGPGTGGPDPRVALHWTNFGGTTVERSGSFNFFPPDGAWALKVFGGETTVGAYQDVEVLPGDDVTISAWLYSPGNDRIGGDAEAKIKLEFLDAAEQPIGTGTELTVLSASTPADTWTPGTVGPLAAPPGAVKARMVCVWTYTSASNGAAYWDDCQLSVNGGPNELLNGGFEEPGFGTGPNPYGIDNWIGFGYQVKSEDVASHGVSSVDVQVGDQSGATYSGLYQDTVELEAGDHLYLRSLVWVPGTGGLSGTSAAAIKLEFREVSGSQAPPPEEALDFDVDSPTDQWVPISYTTTVPPEITLARIVLIANDTQTTNGPIYMDCASAERGSQPGVNQLLNASFEQGSSGVNGLTSWTEFRGMLCRAAKNTFEIAARDCGTPESDLSVLKISGSCVAGIYQDIEVTPGEQLTISVYAWSRADMPFNHPESTAGVKVEWRSGQVPEWIDIGGAPGNTLYADAPRDQWLPVWIDYTMPPGSNALIRCTVIAARGNAVDARVYFDAYEAVVLNRFDGADVDTDNDQDLRDFRWLQYAFSGPGGPMRYNGIVYDFDDDEDVDMTDANYFFPRLTGPN